MKSIYQMHIDMIQFSLLVFVQVIRYSTMDKQNKKDFDNLHVNNSNRFQWLITFTSFKWTNI